MTDSILIVGCGFPQLGLLRFCRSEGLRVIGLDGSTTAVGRELCDDFVHASTTDVPAIVAGARAHGVQGLTTCGSEHALLPTSIAAEELGLPFYGPSNVVRACALKHDMRAAYERGGAPSPAHKSVTTLVDARAFLAAVGLPVVVKPTRGWGQRGVRVVREDGEFDQAVADALETASIALKQGGSTLEPSCLVEAFIPGREFSVDAFTVDGVTEVLAVTERIITGYPDPPGITFAEVFPCELPEAQLEAVKDAAIRGAAALGIVRGPTYTQVRSGERGTFIVETAYRLGGGLDPDVTFLASGVSLYRKIVGVALGRSDWERAGREATPFGGATGRFIVGKPGRVVAIENLESARRMPGVVDAQIYVSVGGTVHPLTDGSKRAGHVLASGSSRAEAEANAHAAMAHIQIVTEAP